MGLRKVVPQGLDAVCADTVRRYFGKCRRYEVAYRKGVDINVIGKVVQKYKSHRRVFDKSGVVQKLVDAGVISEADFSGLCSCSTCEPDQPKICYMPRCPTHGIIANMPLMKNGEPARLTDKDTPRLGYKETAKAAVDPVITRVRAIRKKLLKLGRDDGLKVLKELDASANAVRSAATIKKDLTRLTKHLDEDRLRELLGIVEQGGEGEEQEHQEGGVVEQEQEEAKGRDADEEEVAGQVEEEEE